MGGTRAVDTRDGTECVAQVAAQQRVQRAGLDLVVDLGACA
jgi:hypothetical protein